MSVLDLTLFDSYRDMYRPYLNAVNTRLAKYNLYASQWIVLRLIMQKGTCTLADLAKETRVEKPSVTRTIQRLMELEYVEVKQGDDDRREKYVHLTNRGKNVFKSIQQELSSYMKEISVGISEEDLDTAKKVLNRILLNILG